MPRLINCAIAAIVTTACLAVAASAAQAPTPKTYGGAKESLFATGLKNPTSFAFGDGKVFAGDSGNSAKVPNGGVYVIQNGKGVELPNSPLFVGGMTFHAGALYLSGGTIGSGGIAWEIMKWSGWTGTNFTNRKVLYTAPKTFQGFNGVAFGPGGRLYVGVNLGLVNNNDHGPASLSPDLYDILSIAPSGGPVKVYASGIRQPWQMAYDAKANALYTSDLGQDSAAKNPPDFVLLVHKGDNYGFPKCNWTTGSKCSHATKPFKMLSPHFDPMGIALVGKTLYLGSFMGIHAAGGGALYSIPVSGGNTKPVVTGFPAATDALAYNGGYLYAGGQTQAGAGVVYRVKP
jgi:glucose/arabinose dehydrogenase